jgi:cytochrome d ubiquinol oxidase subunit I
MALIMAPSGFIAVLAGWTTAESGRQPYTVYGLLRTSDSVSPVDAPAIGSSLLAFVLVYLAVFGAGAVYMLRVMSKPPQRFEPDLPRDAGITPGPAQEIEGADLGGS